MIDHLTDRVFSPDEMVASGVYRRDDATGRLRPFFVHKLIVTIRDIQGRPVAFAGRKMGDGEGPKYINSPDCELFSKRSIVYNADRAAVQAAAGDRQTKLVEGYFDVMAMEKAGLGPVVSCMGTSATVEQMETIWKLNRQGRNEPVLCFDGDAAGHDAAQKAAERFLPLITPTRSVRFAMLSGAHDPASLLERPDGRGVLEREIERAISGPMVLYRREASLLPETPSPEDIAAFHSGPRQQDRQANPGPQPEECLQGRVLAPQEGAQRPQACHPEIRCSGSAAQPERTRAAGGPDPPRGTVL